MFQIYSFKKKTHVKRKDTQNDIYLCKKKMIKNEATVSYSERVIKKSCICSWRQHLSVEENNLIKELSWINLIKGTADTQTKNETVPQGREAKGQPCVVISGIHIWVRSKLNLHIYFFDGEDIAKERESLSLYFSSLEISKLK